MVVLEIYSKTLKNVYKTTLCSKATIFIFVTTIISIVFPFVLSYRSKGFWLKHDTFYEQPNVKFKATYLFHALTNNPNNPIICNNFPYHQENSHFDTCNNIKVQEVDVNFDGKFDEFNFNLTLDLPENIKISTVNLLLILDYRLQTVCPARLETAAIYQKIIPNFTTKIEILSELTVSQSFPLHCSRREYFINDKIIENEHNEENYLFENIFTSYLNRNLTTHLSNIYTTIKTDGPSINFVLILKIKYPIHRIYYKTGFWQLIKWAWIQYFPIYVIFLYIIRKITNYVFDNKLVLYYEESPLKKNL